jgi:hypothetical protein
MKTSSCASVYSGGRNGVLPEEDLQTSGAMEKKAAKEMEIM